LVPLVGWPPNAHGTSSWKKCGMSVWKVFRMSSKKSARAGDGVMPRRAIAAAAHAMRNENVLDIIGSSNCEA
jgi:hypothetical protein